LNKTLDIIKYITFRPRNSKVISILVMPIAFCENQKCKEYYFDITNMKYAESLINKYPIHLNYHVCCDIRTSFGDMYKGHWKWHMFSNEEEQRIIVCSNEEMKYEENHYLKSKHDGGKFGLMEFD